MKYKLIAVLFLFASCQGSDAIEEHNSYHEMDNAPFTYSAEFDDGVFVLSIMPKIKGEVFFPAFIEYSNSGDNFLGDLVFSTSKVNSDIHYTQEKTENGINTIIEIPITDIKIQIGKVNFNMAVHFCEVCLDKNETIRNNIKLSKRGHMWGEHYHIDIVGEKD